MKNYNLNDYEILYLIGENDEDAFQIIIDKYKPLIVSLAVKYFSFSQNLGLSIEDFIQEGRIGLYSATKNYNPATSMFYTMASTCISNCMKKLIKRNSCQKHKYLNESLNFDTLSDSNDINCTYDSKNKKDLSNILIDEETQTSLIHFKNTLSDLNAQIFELKINNFSYKEISLLLSISEKKVDNCLLSIRKCAKKHFNIEKSVI